MATPLVLPRSDDDQRRAALRRMRRWPLALLGGAAALFILGWWQASQPGAPAVWGFVRAAGEAGMVGGLADWFAVTALFRHPLGLPIPHTALIPSKKDQLGESLAQFVRTNFLQADAVRMRIEGAQPGLRLGAYLDDDGHRRRIVSEVTSLSAVALRSVDDAEAQLAVRNIVFEHAAAYAWAPPAGTLLSAVLADRAHEPAVDLLLRAVRDWLVDHEQDVVVLVADRGPAQGFFLARAAHEQVGRRVYLELLRWVEDCLANRHCPTRRALDGWLADTAERLQHDPAMIARVELFKQRLLAGPEAHEAVAALWPTLKRFALEHLDDPDSEVHEWLRAQLARLSTRLLEDDEFRARVDVRIAESGAGLVHRYGDEAALLVTETVSRWDASDAADRIELHVGRDLQYIRINGTVVGALAGVAIHAIGVLALG